MESQSEDIQRLKDLGVIRCHKDEFIRSWMQNTGCE